jgi:hypothetical protein
VALALAFCHSEHGVTEGFMRQFMGDFLLFTQDAGVIRPKNVDFPAAAC